MLPLAAVLAVACALVPAPARAASCPARGLALLVETGQHRLWTCENGRATGEYAVALGSGGVGKTRRGDAKVPLFLKHCGIDNASALIITINAQSVIDEIVAVALDLRSDIVIVSRARDADHARRLYSAGVTDAVPETIEASLQLSEAALVGLGVPTGPVIASIHEKRDEFRRELQQATGDTSRPIRGIRAKVRRQQQT